MKFYGIDAQGYIKIQQTAGSTPPTFSTGDERRLIYVHDTVNSEDRVYLGGDQANNWTRVVLDDGASTYTGLIGELDTLYHPLGGSDGSAIKASQFNGITGENKIKTSEDWIYVAVGDPVNSTGGQGKRGAGLIVEINPIGNENDDAAMFYDGTSVIDPDGYGHEWKIKGPTYLGSMQRVATREWVDNFYLKESVAITESTASLINYYTAVASDGRFVRLDDYYGDVILNSPTKRESGWTVPLAQQYFSSYEYTGLEDGVNITGLASYSVVARNSLGDIKARIGNLQATSAQYADLAEKYHCDKSIPVGTIVEVAGDETEYEVVPCMFELSPVVVGVVSENPAHLMNGEADGLPIGLTGRVPVRVIGGVNKGDFIVSAGNGLARKGEPHELVFKIGVALESGLQITEKLVECIIK